VIFNDRVADVAERYLKKGSKVYIEGALQTRKWTDQSGAEKYTTEVVIGKFKGELTLLDGRGEGGGGGAYESSGDSSDFAAPRQQSPSRAPASGSGGGGWDAPADLDDEIPF